MTAAGLTVQKSLTSPLMLIVACLVARGNNYATAPTLLMNYANH